MSPKYQISQVGRKYYQVISIDDSYTDEYQIVYDSFIAKPLADIAKAGNVMVEKIVAAGLWGTKLDFFHLEGGHTDDNDESKINWINPGTYDLYVDDGSPDFLAHFGFKGDGSVDVMKNNCLLDGNGKFKQDDAALGVLIVENISETKGDMGVEATHDVWIMSRTDTTSMRARINDQQNHYSPAGLPNTDGRGMWVVTRPAALNKKIYKDGVRIQAATTASTGVPGSECNFLTNGSLKSTRRQACVIGGAGLDETDNKIIADAVADYFRTVGGYAYNTVDVIIIGDKTAASDREHSEDVDFSLLFKHPITIIGMGDFGSETQTQAQLMTRYDGYKGVQKIWSCVGNHDIYGDDPTDFMAYFNLTKTYYTKVIGSVEYFFWDCLLKPDESGWDTMAAASARTIEQSKASTQGQWLIAAMAASVAPWKVLVYHIPTWCSNYNLNTSPQMAWDWYAYGIDLILNGHMHFYERLLVDTGTGDVPVINAGTSGANQLTIGTPHADSIIRINDGIDADFESGMFLTMAESAIQLSLSLNSVDESLNVIADKDTLVLNK